MAADDMCTTCGYKEIDHVVDTLSLGLRCPVLGPIGSTGQFTIITPQQKQKVEVGQVWSNAQDTQHKVVSIEGLKVYTTTIHNGQEYRMLFGIITPEGYPANWGHWSLKVAAPTTPQETECRVRSCRRRNWTDAKTCWWCSAPDPTKEQKILKLQ